MVTIHFSITLSKIDNIFYFIITYSVNTRLMSADNSITLSKINYILYLFITHFVYMEFQLFYFIFTHSKINHICFLLYLNLSRYDPKLNLLQNKNNHVQLKPRQILWNGGSNIIAAY